MDKKEYYIIEGLYNVLKKYIQGDYSPSPEERIAIAHLIVDARKYLESKS